MNNHFLQILVVVVVLSCKVKGQSVELDHCMVKLFNLEKDQVQVYIDAVKDESERAYINHYCIFLNRMVNGQNLESYNHRFKSIIDSLLDYQYSNTHSLGYLSEVYLQKGMMDYSNGDHTSAVMSFFKAYNYWKKSEKLFPQLEDNNKLKGIFNLLIGNLPPQYKKWASWLGYVGDTSNGMYSLERYLNQIKSLNGKYYEAMLYLSFSYLKFETDEEKIVEFISDNSNKNLPPIIKSILIRCAFKVREPAICKAYLFDTNNLEFLPLLYLKGKFEVLHGYPNAQITLKKYIERNKNGIFKADATRYLSWYYFLSSDTLSFNKLQKKIIELNLYPTWEDKQAKYEAKKVKLPSKILLQSRLTFDSGDAKKAKEILLKGDYTSLENEQKVEFNYRLGRCYHLLDQEEAAIYYYNRAINLGETSNRYFAPYAAIYAAQIKHKKDNSAFQFYIKEADRLNDGEHKLAIKKRIEQLKSLQ